MNAIVESAYSRVFLNEIAFVLEEILSCLYEKLISKDVRLPSQDAMHDVLSILLNIHRFNFNYFTGYFHNLFAFAQC